MKKILLASTFLVGTAGFATAQVTFSGEAYVGMGYSTGFNEGPAFDDINGDGVPTVYGAIFRPEVTASFTAAMMTTTDGGLEAGASITIDAAGASFESDYGDRRFGWWSNDTSGSISDANAYMSGSFGKLAVDYDHNGVSNAGPDGVYGPPATVWGADDISTWDVTLTYTNTWGDFGVEAYYTIAVPGVLGSTNGDLGVKGTYTFGDYMVYASYDRDASAGPDNLIGAGAEGTFSGFTVGADAKYNVTTSAWDSYGAHASYATGPYSVGMTVDRDFTGAGGWDYGATAGYDMGGGVMLEGAFMHDFTQNQNLVTGGVSLAF